MKKFIAILAVLAILFSTAEAQLISGGVESLLRWYDDFALIGLWKRVWNILIVMGVNYVCENYGGYAVEVIADTMDIDASAYDAATACSTGYDLLYAALWYKTGEDPGMNFGDYSQYIYA